MVAYMPSLKSTKPSEGDDILIGGSGDDLIIGYGGNDWIYGRDGDDTLIGDDGKDSLFGDKGNDELDGRAGNDRMVGGAGDDRFDLDTGKDTIEGGAGIDLIYLDSASKGVTMSLAAGSVKIVTNFGTGTTTFKGVERVIGSYYNDTLRGDNGFNILSGGSGNDKTFGLGGRDIMVLGDGKDTATGGTGSDTFLFVGAPDEQTNIDRILDFGTGNDKLGFSDDFFDLTGVGRSGKIANFVYKSIAADEFQASEGHEAATADVRIIYDTKTGSLYYDSNGNEAGGETRIAHLAAGLDIEAADLRVYTIQDF